MTLEITPSVVVFGDNDNSLGNTVSQDTAFSVEMHLTRDMTSRGFISLDYTWVDGGDQELTSNLTGLPAGSTNGIDATLAGFTLGYEINDNLSLRVAHMQTINESSDPFALTGSLTRIQLVWGWHDVLEPRRRFRGE
jgi:hypothetical protein